MATKVVMEALSPTMEEGRLVEWKKQEGDPVAVGDVIAEVETDKAVMELVARAGGVLLRQLVPAGATVPVSQPVGWIGAAGGGGGGGGGRASRGGGELQLRQQSTVNSQRQSSQRSTVNSQRELPRGPPRQPRLPPSRLRRLHLPTFRLSVLPSESRPPPSRGRSPPSAAWTSPW